MARRRSPGTPAGLDAGRVVDAATALVAEGGVEALSMRAVAHRLGVAPNALYSHVADKDALLDMVTDALLADPPVGGDAGWRVRLDALGRHAWGATRGHPVLAARLLHAGHAPVLLLFDVDHFKTLNDRLGHAAGDRALQLVGAGLRETLRAGDIAGRLGGDEFALLLADVTLRQAVGVADRLLQRIQSHAPAQRLPRLGLSFGLVQTRAGETVDEALRRADQALYEAKRQGRSCLVTAQGEEHRPVFSESQRLGLTEA